MIVLDASNTPRRSQAKEYEIPVRKKKKISIRWTGKQVARLREERKASLKREKEKSYKVTLNVLIVTSRGIMLKTATRNRSKIEKLE
jgi:hypothetical protein